MACKRSLINTQSLRRVQDLVMCTGQDLVMCIEQKVVTFHSFIVQESKCSFDDLLLAPATLAELVNAIEEGLVSGKIGKQVLPDLLQVHTCHMSSIAA